MSTKHKSPFRDGSKLGKVFDHMRKVQVYTRNDLIEFAQKEVVADEKKASAFVTILLTPRIAGECKGDERGNPAVWGHYWYNEKLDKVTGSKQKFRLRWRDKVLAPVRESVRGKVDSEKGEKTSAVKESVEA